MISNIQQLATTENLLKMQLGQLVTIENQVKMIQSVIRKPRALVQASWKVRPCVNCFFFEANA